MKHQEEITRSAGLVGSLTFLSRIAGYARDVVIAYFSKTIFKTGFSSLRFASFRLDLNRVVFFSQIASIGHQRLGSINIDYFVANLTMDKTNCIIGYFVAIPC